MSPSKSADSPVLLGTVRNALHEDIRTADRITTVLTRSVPWHLPGRLLQAVADISPRPVEQSQITQGVIAVEYACLHQYLHAIPRADASLEAPVADSPYATDPVAAMLDGDSLQACAFSRLERVSGDASLLSQCYEQLAAESVVCYEQESQSSTGALLDLAPLAGVATYLGARYGGFSQQRATSLKEVAATLGESIPVHTPSGWSRGTERTEDVTARLTSLLGGTPAVHDRIGDVVDTAQAVAPEQR